MTTHVISVHGFNIYDAGKNTVAKILPYFEQQGCTTEVFNYGYFNLFNPRWRNQKIADKLSKRVRELNEQNIDVVIVAHSNGCTITHETHDCVINNAVYINPALDRWRVFPDTIQRAQVWYSPSDRTLWLAKILPFHPLGAMGAFGYMGKFDPRIKNYNKQHDYPISSKGHSDVFEDGKLHYFAQHIIKEALR